MSAQAYPLQWPDGWPRTEASSRRWSQFKTTPEKALSKLKNELRIMGAKSVVVSSNARLTRFGDPYSEDMRKQNLDVGVAVYFMWKRKPYVMARDAYAMIFENVMSIAHAVEHMRGLSRHGGDFMMQQAFSGFTALPAPDNVKPARPWWEVLGLPEGQYNRDVIEAMHRVKAKELHPDKGGSDEAMAELNRAREEALKA